MAFRHSLFFILGRFWLETLFASNSNLCQKFFPGFSSSPLEVTVLFDRNLSRRTFHGQVTEVNLDLLLCSGIESGFGPLSYNFQGQIDDKKPEDWAKRWAWPWSVTCSREINEISFSHEKKINQSSSASKCFRALKPFGLHNRVSIATVAALRKASRLLPAATAST